jgi:DNA-binding response OmpR family regulator
VKALLRRAELVRAASAPGAAADAADANGELEIQPAKRQVRLRGGLVEFTALEFDLLLHFASHPGRCFRAGNCSTPCGATPTTATSTR